MKRLFSILIIIATSVSAIASGYPNVHCDRVEYPAATNQKERPLLANKNKAAVYTIVGACLGKTVYTKKSTSHLKSNLYVLRPISSNTIIVVR